MKDKILFWLGARLAWLVLITIGKTLQIKVSGAAFHQQMVRRGSFIYALWHGRMFLPMYFLRGESFAVLVSQHRDGEFVSRVLLKLGYRLVRGSTTSGGQKALKQMLTSGQGEQVFCFTPDGPKGPKGKVQPGVIFLAQHTGMPILPVTGAARKRKMFKSWDRFVFPLLFSRCALVFGRPLFVERNLGKEQFNQYCVKLENRLNRITRQAERMCRK